MIIMTNQEEAKNFNALNILAGGDYRKLKIILEKHKSWSEAWKKNNDGKINCEKEWDKLKSLGIRIILKEDEQYPALLKEIDWPPFALYIKGSLPAKKTVAIVGTRKATAIGRAFAQNLAKELSVNDISVVSGLALGIDEAAHWGAVKARAETIAVLPTGLDRIYPNQNAGLAEKILESGGALISEYPIGTTSYPSNFIHRNRIVSGLCIGTVIIEAPEKSGSLTTAKFALQQNREVFIAPGPVNHPNYKASHSLIRAGARLVTSAEEILDDLNLDFKKQNNYESINTTLNEEEKQILETIKENGWPIAIDKIHQKTKIDIPKINRIITFLTIKGLIK
ncbi:MAG: DNA processing protein [Parcubacteria group bacterium Athens0714_26]|nr:MAG: DNA processing protein [Parcubacteria group bacterium Athens1014_26]TSD02665.1 MAG: DNA processing protein [Parcubacteria group bacterium Athens0714_26]